VTIHESADISPGAEIDPTAAVWHLAQVRERARVAENVVVGRGAYIGVGVHVGPNAKIQNHALVYEPATIGAGAFIGPAVVLTNDRHPRAVTPDGVSKGEADWEPVGVIVGPGASIGAGAICVAPVRIGDWAMVGAGAVVTDDVPDFALVLGCPARRVGWVGREGVPLVESSLADGRWHCPRSGDVYQEDESGTLVAVELP
jgi:acetyltransferase-like isoleucine patch superfamily enzyme